MNDTSSDKTNKKKAGCLKIGFVVIVVIFMIMIIISSAINALTNETDNSGHANSSDSNLPDTKLTRLELKERIEKEAKRTIAKEILQTRFVGQIAGEDAGGLMLDIEYKTEGVFSNSMTRRSMIQDTLDFVKRVSQNEDYGEVKIYMLRPFLNLKDQYGNSKSEQVAKIVFRKAVADRINWRDITTEQFELLIETEGTLWWHPALRN